MKSSDANITHADIRRLREQAMEKGWGHVALDVLARESVLAAAVSNRWAKIRVMLEGLGLTEEQANPVLMRVSRMMVEIGCQRMDGRDRKFFWQPRLLSYAFAEGIASVDDHEAFNAASRRGFS